MSNTNPPETAGQAGASNAFTWTLLALAAALAGVAGSLWLSIGMGLKPCPLCYYQRTFLMAAAAVLLVGLLTEIRNSAHLPLLALPAVTGGLGVGVFHVYLEQTGKLECPLGVLGWGTAPAQSLAVFLIVFVVLLVPLVRASAHWIAAVLLGLLLSLGAILSAPPLPGAPSEPYDQPLKVCRPPYASSVDAE